MFCGLETQHGSVTSGSQRVVTLLGATTTALFLASFPAGDSPLHLPKGQPSLVLTALWWHHLRTGHSGFPVCWMSLHLPGWSQTISYHKVGPSFDLILKISFTMKGKGVIQRFRDLFLCLLQHSSQRQLWRKNQDCSSDGYDNKVGKAHVQLVAEFGRGHL